MRECEIKIKIIFCYTFDYNEIFIKILQENSICTYLLIVDIQGTMIGNSGHNGKCDKGDNFHKKIKFHRVLSKKMKGSSCS